MRTEPRVADLHRVFWKCSYPGCEDQLVAFSDNALEVLKGFHLAAHFRRDPNGAASLPFTLEDSEWLMQLAVDPMGRDERSTDELEARYKEKQ